MVCKIIVKLYCVLRNANITTVSQIQCLRYCVLVLSAYFKECKIFRFLANPKVVIVSFYFVKSQIKINLIDISIESLRIKCIQLYLFNKRRFSIKIV